MSTRFVPRPLREFLETEAAGGVVLLVAMAGALVWANSPWADGYAEFWHTEISLSVGDYEIGQDLRHWVNEGLMTIFFFVVGLEIKRELVDGELRDPRRAVLPIVAALGGMLLPALIYLAVAGGDAPRGWGIPTATDIAFAVGVLALLGSRIPSGLKVFLLSVAIVDDVGAILLIAVFYSAGVQMLWLLGAAALLGVMALLHLRGVRALTPFVIVGAGVWFATLQSGIHATIAGAMLGLLAPPRARDPDALTGDPVGGTVTAATVRALNVKARETVSVLERLEYALHPWTSYFIIPVFALANAGIRLDGDVGGALTSRVAIGVALGLVLGKTAGISLAALIAVRLRLAILPAATTWRHIIGAAMVAGIGFTVALFIVGLAFVDVQLEEQAKMGILAGSSIAAVGGLLWLARLRPDETEA